jgi:hypothetical protein
MVDGIQRTGTLYREYLQRRREGGAREYFSCRAHALCFLRAVAPTKLVDGAWLYGLLQHWRNPRFVHLAHTYIEELGEGASDKNHVLLYRRLLTSHGIDDWKDQSDDRYTQGALQLALATCGERLAPEVIGFNLGYEQLPLHLLISSFELNELGIDPYYFTLHVTVDNAASGHARRAVDAVLDALPQTGGAEDYWARIRRGYRLNEIGMGTTSAIASFDLHAEFLRILESKAFEGRIAHSDYCRIEGKPVSEWLSDDAGVGGFVEALGRKDWLRRGVDPSQSRFWRLLRSDHAEMFGVFSEYQLQVIYDWIRGPASADGAAVPVTDHLRPEAPPRTFRQQRARKRVPDAVDCLIDIDIDGVDPDAAAFDRRMAGPGGADEKVRLTLEMMGPAQHWSAAGLRATRLFSNALIRSRGA